MKTTRVLAWSLTPASLVLAAGLALAAGEPGREGGEAALKYAPPLPGSFKSKSPKEVEPNPMMLRFPAVSKDSIAFVYANDIWLVSRSGGPARPLSARRGRASFPRFSPDGQTLGFVGNFEGNADLYTLPINGGDAQRVTHHPAGETLCGWTADGASLLYLTNGFAGLGRQTQLFKVSAAGGMPEQLPVPYGGFGSINADGEWLAYTTHSIDTRTWKRYRGGMATDVWLFNLKTKQSEKITDWEGTDTLPMWSGKTVHYLSDNGPEHRLNIWSYDPATKKRAQVTAFKDDDVRWPSMGPGASGQGEIIFQLGKSLQILDLGTKKSAEVKVTIAGDRPALKPRNVDPARWLVNASISPSGKRVAAVARGDIWSLPAKDGVPRNMTRTDSIFEREVAWSPDGKWLAYLSDESGEYEVWVRPSDAKAPEEKKDEKKGEAKEEKKPEDGKADEAKPADATPDAGKDAEAKPADTKAADVIVDEKTDAEVKAEEAAKRQPRKLTDLGAGFRQNLNWSPDSKHIAFTDNAGRIFMIDAEGGKLTEVDKDEWGQRGQMSWSHDSGWLAYALVEESNGQSAIWLYNVAEGKKTRVTDPMFASAAPAFDRKGEWLYFSSGRAISSPVYSDLDSSFIYTGTDVMMMAPMRKDVKSPFAPKNDVEELKAEKKDSKKDAGEEKKKDDAAGKDAAKPVADDGVSGTWSCSIGGFAAAGGQALPFSLTLKRDADGKISGSASSALGEADVTDGSFNKETGALSLTIATPGMVVTVTATITGDAATGTWSAGPQSGTFTGSRTGKGGGGEPEKAEGAKDGEKKAEKKEDKKDEKKLVIDLEGFEARAIQMPVPAGAFGAIAVNDSGKVIYVRNSTRGSSDPASIKIFDPSDDAKEEKTVGPGGGFDMSADGKKLLLVRGGSVSIIDASAGGKSQTVPTGGLRQAVRPREEWRQIFVDAWRLCRDYFYEPTMHGVDWPGIRDHYAASLDDCSSREDVQWVIGEMISELNVGHAYVQGPGDVEDTTNVPVGMLGADYALEGTATGTAYKITKIYAGAVWDVDAKGPLSQPGVDVKVGDYLLAVNGVPVDTSKDIYASFVGMAERTVSITVSSNPLIDGDDREVLVRPIGAEGTLRYRTWIERNRQYVFEKSGGKIGYIYVPNTGQDGQSDLFRQFYGQRGMGALLIDERWNGGGQIPNRFIELLNRPRTNYWARRDAKDWPWPTDSHQGPKAMLINGLAGSGGDMFPWLFKHNGLGKLIGMRTWGGLVGISGNPAFIDGGSISVPTFGFYETDGTWGIEGHGVDADIVVIDDPAKMQDGGDPQLDAGITHLMDELKTKAYVPAKRPKSPNRAGMGTTEADR